MKVVPTTEIQGSMQSVLENKESSNGVPAKNKTTSEKTTTKVSSSSSNHDEEDHDEWRIVLYYCYLDLSNHVDEHVNFQQELCTELELPGRIRVSAEGINGVLSGKLKACQTYETRLRNELQRLCSQPGEFELDVKYCPLRRDLPVQTQLFDSLVCKATSHVVSLFDPSLMPSINTDSSTKNKFSKQSNRRRRRQQQRHQKQQDKLQLQSSNTDTTSQELWSQLQTTAEQTPNFPGGQHLSPEEWNAKLAQAHAEDAILLDCRNVYESNVGYFHTPTGPQTLLTNTRKYSDLPKVLAQSQDQWAHKKQIFMYCTGGVRCEVASQFVQAFVSSQQRQQNGDDDGNDQPQKQEVEVYQLHGGIQRYLERFHDQKPLEVEAGETNEGEERLLLDNHENATRPKEDQCLYRGLNFVFDPRRTDPMTANETVGKCLVCNKPHDDYDNGHAPIAGMEARCCKCRILLLVCDACRQSVQCWGEDDKKKELPKLYCGGVQCSDYQATGSNPVSLVSSNGNHREGDTQLFRIS